MNRIDRLTAIILFLQGGKSTATEIAKHFEVSKRTILRDIQALCEIGVPITAELGISGGYTLPPDYYLPPLALTIHESILLHLALSGISQLSETPFKRERGTLLAKLQTLLPQQISQEVEQFQQKLFFKIPAQSLPAPFLERLLESVRNEQWVDVTYRSDEGVTRQTLLPLNMQAAYGLWHCEAYSFEYQEVRVYRIHRFLTVEPAHSPEWLDAQTILSLKTSIVPEVCLRLTERGVYILETDPILGAQIEYDSDGGGWIRQTFPLYKYEWLVRVIMSLGKEVEVCAPETLRQRAQQAAQDIAQYYLQKVT